ncbi:hypothetical protein D920_00642 [Enterococcus faecalis 13-SD-W-01]|nr:hypothetical protein D920_00642 [Enterococcus faecalis 13-SD-W-01]
MLTRSDIAIECIRDGLRVLRKSLFSFLEQAFVFIGWKFQ